MYPLHVKKYLIIFFGKMLFGVYLFSTFEKNLAIGAKGKICKGINHE